jgi:hypothetical protein
MGLKLTSAALMLLLLAPKLQAQSMCLDLFKKEHVSIGEFAEISIDISESSPVTTTLGNKQSTSKKGIVMMSGRQEGRRWDTIIAKLGYSITDNRLLLTSMTEKSEFYGQGVFPTMVETILRKNLQVNTMTVTIIGSFYKQFETDLAHFGDKNQALLANPVYQQLARLGFSKIDMMAELNNNFQSYLLLTVQLAPRPGL